MATVLSPSSIFAPVRRDGDLGKDPMSPAIYNNHGRDIRLSLGKTYVPSLDYYIFKSFQNIVKVEREVVTSSCHGSKISGWQKKKTDNSTYIGNSHCLKLDRSYSISSYLRNDGELFCVWIRSDRKF